MWRESERGGLAGSGRKEASCGVYRQLQWQGSAVAWVGPVHLAYGGASETGTQGRGLAPGDVIMQHHHFPLHTPSFLLLSKTTPSGLCGMGLVILPFCSLHTPDALPGIVAARVQNMGQMSRALRDTGARLPQNLLPKVKRVG